MNRNNWHLNIENAEYLKKIYKCNNISNISKQLGFSFITIKKMLKEINVNLRSEKESRLLGATNRLKFIEISYELEQIINGCLLGDGYIVNKTNRQAYFVQSCIHKDYIIWLKNQFDKCGIVSKIRFVPEHFDKRGIKNSNCWVFTTRSYVNFLEIYNKWYNNKIKIVPKNIILSQNLLKNWWIGDGYLNKKSGIGTVASHGFTEIENIFLKNLLSLTLKDNVVIRKDNTHNKYYLYLPRKTVNKLIDYIGSCLVESFEYKWSKKC